MRQVGQSIEGWRIQLEQLISNRQPFHLVYGKPNRDFVEFSVRLPNSRPMKNACIYRYGARRPLIIATFLSWSTIVRFD